MYPFHPITVHAPIGLLIGNIVLTALYLYRGDRTLETGAYHCLWLGWLFLVPAVITGIVDAARQLTGPLARTDALMWVNAHAFIGLVLMAVYWQAWQMRRRNPAILDDRKLRRGYLARLAIGAALLVLTGWLGGVLVYSLRLGVDM